MRDPSPVHLAHPPLLCLLVCDVMCDDMRYDVVCACLCTRFVCERSRHVCFGCLQNLLARKDATTSSLYRSSLCCRTQLVNGEKISPNRAAHYFKDRIMIPSSLLRRSPPREGLSSPPRLIPPKAFPPPPAVQGSAPRSADDSPEDQELYKASGAHCFLGKARAAFF